MQRTSSSASLRVVHFNRLSVFQRKKKPSARHQTHAAREAAGLKTIKRATATSACYGPNLATPCSARRLLLKERECRTSGTKAEV